MFRGAGWRHGLVLVLVAMTALVWKVADLERLVDTLDDICTYLQAPKDHLANHRYLHGNFAPVRDEQTTPIPLLDVVEGAIPSDLQGLYLRTGPNPLPGWTKRYTWFDGHGMLHMIRFQNGTATYANQYIATPRYEIERTKGKDYFLRIGELYGVTGIVKALLNFIKLAFHGLTMLTSGPANTASIMFAGRFYLLNEANLPLQVRFHPNGTLETLGFADFNGVLDYPVSAHPKVDYHHQTPNQHLLFHSYATSPYQLWKDGSYKVGELLPNGTLQSYQGIRTPDHHVCFAHDLIFTPNYILLYDSSVHLDMTQILRGKPLMTWKENQTLRLALIDRTSSQPVVTWYDTGLPKVLIHWLNAWEEGDPTDANGTIVAWAPLGDHWNLDDNENASNKTCNHYVMSEVRIHPGTKSVSIEPQLQNDGGHSQEFCSVRKDYYGKFSEYGVAGILDDAHEAMFRGFVVWNLRQKVVSSTVWYQDGEWGGEPVVMEKPGMSEAKDFYVGSITYHESSAKSYFCLYDHDELVVKLRLPYRVPFGFHGNWYPEDMLQEHYAHFSSSY